MIVIEEFFLHLIIKSLLKIYFAQAFLCAIIKKNDEEGRVMNQAVQYLQELTAIPSPTGFT